MERGIPMSTSRDGLAANIPLMQAGNEAILTALAAHGYTVATYPATLPTPRAQHAAAAKGTRCRAF